VKKGNIKRYVFAIAAACDGKIKVRPQVCPDVHSRRDKYRYQLGGTVANTPIRMVKTRNPTRKTASLAMRLPLEDRFAV
jgi:hypothetical protein